MFLHLRNSEEADFYNQLANLASEENEEEVSSCPDEYVETKCWSQTPTHSRPFHCITPPTQYCITPTTQDIPVTAEETKQLVDSVDVDNMDASLFGSFSHSQRNKGRPSKSRSFAKLPLPSATQGKGREGSRLVPDTHLDRSEVSPQEKTPGLPAHIGERKKELLDVDQGDRHVTAITNGDPKAYLKEQKSKSQKSGMHVVQNCIKCIAEVTH